jgi:16S rRNA (cytosine967-C5)-methyltransferase
MSLVQRLATQAVAAVLAGRSLTATLQTLLSHHPELTAADRSALWDISHGTLRQLGLLRALMTRLLHRPLKERGLEALVAVALYQLEFTRAAPYAVVDQAVDTASGMGWPWAKAMVNALLRRFQREREALLGAVRSEPVAFYSYPAWWIGKLRAQYPEHWEHILELGNRPPRLSLRVNLRRTTRSAYLDLLSAEGITARPCGEVGVILERVLPVARIPGFAAGLVSVQDLGAQRAAAYLDLATGQRVLDACAAPGGKTAHILERCDVNMLALDHDAARVEKISANLARLGLQARIRCADAAVIESWWDGEAFDRVIADVPCTASGIVRRHPDIKWLRREDDISALARQSARLLDALWRVVKPGGKLLFATCSIFREENRAQVDDFVGRHADARIAPLPVEEGQDVLLLPDDSHDGFYYALLERR